MGTKAELILAVLIGTLILVSVAQTVQLVDLSIRATSGSITIKPTGYLAERKSSSSYSAPSPSLAGGAVAGPGCG